MSIKSRPGNQPHLGKVECNIIFRWEPVGLSQLNKLCKLAFTFGLIKPFFFFSCIYYCYTAKLGSPQGTHLFLQLVINEHEYSQNRVVKDFWIWCTARKTCSTAASWHAVTRASLELHSKKAWMHSDCASCAVTAHLEWKPSVTQVSCTSTGSSWAIFPHSLVQGS